MKRKKSKISVVGDDAQVESTAAAVVVDDGWNPEAVIPQDAFAKVKVGRKRGSTKAKATKVSGTNTWRDGLTPEVVAKWETWVVGFIQTCRDRGVKIDPSFDGKEDLLKECCCTFWRNARNVNEAKLRKEVPLFVA